MSHNDNKLYEALKKGYAEMAEINAALAQECIVSDNEALEISENNLTECE